MGYVKNDGMCLVSVLNLDFGETDCGLEGFLVFALVVFMIMKCLLKSGNVRIWFPPLWTPVMVVLILVRNCLVIPFMSMYFVVLVTCAGVVGCSLFFLFAFSRCKFELYLDITFSFVLLLCLYYQ